MSNVMSTIRHGIAVIALSTLVAVTAARADVVIGKQGTNAPGSGTDFTFTIPANQKGVCITFGAQANLGRSHLYLKKNGTPTETDFDYVSRSDLWTNRICIEPPEFDPAVTNYGLRVFTPPTSPTHNFMVAIAASAPDRAIVRPAIKPVSFTATGILTNSAPKPLQQWELEQWQVFQVDVPSPLTGAWRITAHGEWNTNVGEVVIPDLYVAKEVPPNTNAWLKADLTRNPRQIVLTNGEITAGTWFIGVHHPGSGSPSNMVYSLECVVNASATPNDLCAGAIVVGGPAYTNAQSTVAATSQDDPMPSDMNMFGNGVWYRFTAPTNGRLAVDTRGSDFDTGLGIYTGNCGNLMELASNDDTDSGDADDLCSELSVAVTEGTSYSILAGGYDAETGDLTLHLTFIPDPPLQFETEAGAIVLSNGFFLTRATGPTNATVVIEQSSTLTNWTPCLTNTLTNGVWEIPMPIGTNRHLFFRLKIQ
jgi:hypothetical protein